MSGGVSKSGSPISRWMISCPLASSALAFASTEKAVSVPSRSIRLATSTQDSFARTAPASPITSQATPPMLGRYLLTCNGAACRGTSHDPSLPGRIPSSPRTSSGHEKAGPRRDPLSKRWCSAYLPNDPAGQEPTGHQQRTRAKREQRGTTRVGKLAARSSRGGAAAATTATATATGRSRGRGRGLLVGNNGSISGVDVDVLASGDAVEAREHLVL